MDERFAILTLLSAEQRTRITGRTLLQKKIYFLNEILDLGINFRPYYYGPYSDSLANALDSLVAMGFVSEDCETFPKADDPFGDQKRYQYSLSSDGQEALQVFAESEDDGKAKQMVELIDKMDKCAQAHDYKNLSVAAKIFLIVKNKGKANVDELKKEASGLGWQLPNDLISSSIEFLKSMDLVEARQTATASE